MMPFPSYQCLCLVSAFWNGKPACKRRALIFPFSKSPFGVLLEHGSCAACECSFLR